MDVFRTAEELNSCRSLREKGPLVLVPTMGALHEGHLSLVRLGRRFGPVVVSVFVNPTQFGEGEDYEAYPRDLAGDLAMLESLEAEAVFTPGLEEMYAGEGEVTVQPGSRAQGLCGSHRPGHFAGVLTVVAKLFGAVRPDVAVFGRKDAQQCLVIAQMVDDLKMPVGLIDGPTIRESDGLAMSSRNRYLNEEQRDQAVCLFRALSAGRDLLTGGERSAAVVARIMREELARADAVEYAEVRQVPGLQTAEKVEGLTLLAVAAQVGPARLIDNIVLDVTDGGVAESILLDDPCNYEPAAGRNG
jgi:pantoate--beta-alanine ligase